MEVSTTSTTDPLNYYNYLNNVILNPTVFVVILIIIIGYFVLSSSLGKNSGENSMSNAGNDSSNNGQRILGIIVIVILGILIVVNALQYFFSINITASISDFFTEKPKIDIIVDQSALEPTTSVPTMRFRKQVFNIPGNKYTYENAKAVCTAYGSRLATYKEVEHAYEKGGEWCNYGWSDGQMALFPTQQKTFDNLQGIKGHEHDCGRPGVNGGYMANPRVRYGINCFGNKPKMTQDEEELMQTSSPYPQTAQDIAFQKLVDFWKNKVDEILVSPFNYDSWGQV